MSSIDSQREERLAAALRANLRRRKDQSRKLAERPEDDGEGGPDGERDPD